MMSLVFRKLPFITDFASLNESTICPAAKHAPAIFSRLRSDGSLSTGIPTAFRILKTHFKKLVIAVALQIPVVRFYSSFHHFIAYGAKSCCLKTKRQTATTSKQVEHQRLLLNMRCKHPIYLIAKFRHYLIAHYKLVQRYNFFLEISYLKWQRTSQTTAIPNQIRLLSSQTVS